MDKFEGKVLGALDKLEKDGVITSEPSNEKLVDPFMQEESPEAFAEKKAKWNDIFNRYPEFADAVIDIYGRRTEKSADKLFNAFKDIISVM